jgi:hypothetical protein
VALPVADDTIGAPPLPIANDIEIAQENTRKYLALALLGLLGIEVLAALLAALFICSQLNMKDALSIVFGPTIALVGAATGFYFGSNSTRSPTNG